MHEERTRDSSAVADDLDFGDASPFSADDVTREGSTPPTKAWRPFYRPETALMDDPRLTRRFTPAEWREVLSKLTPLPRPARLTGDGVYSAGGTEERLGVPITQILPTLPVQPKDRDFERRKTGARPTGFLVNGDGSLQRELLLGDPARGEICRIDGLTKLVFPQGCNVWTNFGYTRSLQNVEGSISITIKRERIPADRTAHSSTSAEYLAGQLLFRFSAEGIRSPAAAAAELTGMLERSATFAAELIRYTTADVAQRVFARSIVACLEIDESIFHRPSRDLCCVFAYALRDSAVYKKAGIRRIAVKLIMSRASVEHGYKRSRLPPALTVSRIASPETFDCLALTQVDRDRTVSRLSIYPDVSSLADVPGNESLRDLSGRTPTELLRGPQGEEIRPSTPGLEHYLARAGATAQALAPA
jgi:hypothetical protein